MKCLQLWSQYSCQWRRHLLKGRIASSLDLEVTKASYPLKISFSNNENAKFISYLEFCYRLCRNQWVLTVPYTTSHLLRGFSISIVNEVGNPAVQCFSTFFEIMQHYICNAYVNNPAANHSRKKEANGKYASVIFVYLGLPYIAQRVFWSITISERKKAAILRGDYSSWSSMPWNALEFDRKPNICRAFYAISSQVPIGLHQLSDVEVLDIS